MMTRTRIIQRYTREKNIFFRCTSQLFFSCCESVAAPVPAKNNQRRRGHWPRHHDQVPATHKGCHHGQRPGHHAQIPVMHNERRRGQRPGATIKYLRRTTSTAAGNRHHDQVPSTHNERRRGQRPGATIKYLQCTTSGAAGNARAQRSRNCDPQRAEPRATA